MLLLAGVLRPMEVEEERWRARSRFVVSRTMGGSNCAACPAGTPEDFLLIDSRRGVRGVAGDFNMVHAPPPLSCGYEQSLGVLPSTLRYSCWDVCAYFRVKKALAKTRVVVDRKECKARYV